MSPGPTFERVYCALKEQIASGRFEPGAHLEPALIGDSLHSSITPVRDALHRLVGERIVEAPRNDGFRVPAWTEAELRDLYGWTGRLLALALVRPPPRAHGFGGAPGRHGLEVDRSKDECEPGTSDLFRRIARLSGSREHERAIETLNDRLEAIRIVERRLLANWAEELAALGEALGAQDWAALRRGIAGYHRRRQRAVPDLLAAARCLS